MDIQNKGKRGVEYRAKARKNMWQFGTSHKKMENMDRPLVFESAEGCWLTDVDGNRYFDALSGVWVVNVGHGRTRIAKTMEKQAMELGYALSEEGFANVRAIELSEKLLQVLPDEFDRVYFASGGSETVEMALRLARTYNKLRRKPKKTRFISRRGSYHGATLLTLSVTGNEYLSQVVAPLAPGLAKIAHPYCYRCEYGYKDCTACNLECAKSLEETILSEGEENVAAFIAEPISTASGVAIPKEGYWEEIRRICDKYDVLLILDEVVTGFGRLGTMFAMEQIGIIPDIVVMAKGITSGYSPLGALATNRKITQMFPENAFLVPGYTYTGHPISCAAALENIAVIQEEGIVENARIRGEQLKRLLCEKLKDHPFVGDIRCCGLLACVEIVKDKENKMQFGYNDKVSDLLSEYFFLNKVYVRLLEGYIHIGPPLIISEEEVEWLTDVVRNALDYLLEKLSQGN